MPIPDVFSYAKPAEISEVNSLLNKFQGKSMILAGGTDLANMLKQGFPVPEIMIDIKAIPALKKIEIVNDSVFIGSCVTFSEIIDSSLIKKHIPILWEAANLVASNGIRNRATMVGNICSAVPCMDSAAPLLVHEALIHLSESLAERTIPVFKWFVDSRKTAIKENQFVTGVSIPLVKQKFGSSYNKMMRYSGEDLAQANVGILALEDKTFRVAFGSVGPIPKRSPKVENLLNKNGFSKETVEEAKHLIDRVIAPISDVRATKEYRYHMTKVMFERGLKTALERLEKSK
ncbi:MAG: FAD binding domain-containing protein [Bacteroidota bacterium]